MQRGRRAPFDGTVFSWVGLVIATAGVLLAGCAHLPDPLAGAARFEGRLSVQVAGDAQRSFSAGFELAGSETMGRLVLTTPLGTQAAQADWSPEQVRLRAGGGERFYPDLESLARDALGGRIEEVNTSSAAQPGLTPRPLPIPPTGGIDVPADRSTAALPLAALFDWLRGRPWPRAASQVRPGGFEQLGWTVDLSRRADGWVMARREAAPEITVRVRLDEGQR